MGLADNDHTVPADQKLNLQIRAQQLMNVMQTMAMQAQNGGLAPTSQFLPFALPNGVGAYTHEQLPAQMQMPMMGSSIPAFPPFPNFFGMPAGFPTPMLPHNGNLTDMHRYTSRAAPSAIGQPTLFQQAGFSEDNSKEASSSPSLQNRRRSQ